MLFHNPHEVLMLNAFDGVEDFFKKIEERVAAGFFVAGWLSYEAAYGMDSALAEMATAQTWQAPLAWFGVYKAPQRFTADEVAQLFPPSLTTAITAPHCSTTEIDHAEQVAAIREEIAAGKVYQVNLTARYHFSMAGEAPALFAALRQQQPASYTAFLNCGERTILSFSPELFFRTDGCAIETRPMKGTAPRGSSAEEDAHLRLQLQQCEKNCAENLMIVDLLRNDLGRICTPATIKATKLFATESWPTLHQMISTISGELRNNVSLYELFQALYPCGSITGAPKISAMQLIQQLEQSPRGIYTGAIGYITPPSAQVSAQTMRFSVAIRTLELQGQHGIYGSGGGIVWDSVAADEYCECQLKTKILESIAAPPFELFETMLWHDGCYLWLNEHLNRLANSAKALGFAFERQATLQQLLAFEVELQQSPKKRCKVKLTLFRNGEVQLDAEAVSPDLSGRLMLVTLAEKPVSSNEEAWLQHKTTLRHSYDSAFAAARAAGYDEVIFCNQRGEITEGAISSIMVRHGSQLLTPSLACGLLNSISRRYLLATRPNLREATLYPNDLVTADMLYIANSVRGIRPAVMEQEMKRIEK
uniref:Para-aminobenzoate synthase, component I n=1 Tax=Chlorobium chlorochromatii (strain CaD3) TaxID=340177 RepID=Q3ATI0_CHLCH